VSIAIGDGMLKLAAAMPIELLMSPRKIGIVVVVNKQMP
jgi:hypothetical protein